MNEYMEQKVDLRWDEPKRSYDVVIIGGGGHGLATAYYLAKEHGISRVAVVEKGWLGGGNTGRNTTVIRANYGIPEAVRFYQRSLELYQSLSDETDRDLMHRQKGNLWLAHTEPGARRERARAEINTAFGATTEFVTPEEIGRICPQIDLSGGGHWPVMGGSYHPAAATARHDRVVWALGEAGLFGLGVPAELGGAEQGLETQLDVWEEISRADGGDRADARPRPRHRGRDHRRPDRRRCRAVGRRRPRHPRRLDGGPAHSHSHPPAAGLRDEPLRARLRPDRHLQ